jgi:hypothetical protein
MYNIPIYFCNIDIKHLKHTIATSRCNAYNIRLKADATLEHASQTLGKTPGKTLQTYATST